MKYDYIVVGSGLYGSIFAHEAKSKGKSVLVVDKRPNIAGNVYTEKQEGINVHMYGAHIFHTNDKRVWNYITQFAEFNRFTNSPVANYKGELYSMPFNMYTFNKMWGVVTPEEAAAKIEEQKKEITGEPKNLEEQAISLVGRDIYEKLVKGYTEKQWGRDCRELPAFIIKRLPVRLTFDNNYFNALYQGIPIGGYTKMVENLLDGIEVRLNTDYLEHKAELDALADKVVYTGPIDAYFGFKLGTLEYRSVRFENETLDIPNFQGNAAVNYTDRETPWTRIIEHKWFEFGKDEDGNDLPKTIISRAPQIRYRYTNKNFQLTGAAVWQSQYTSQGPEGKTHKYLKQSCIPEFYVGADYKNGGLLAGVGIELLSLKPRTESIVNTDKYKVDERITTLSYEAHVKYTNKDWFIAAKSVLGSNLTQASGLGGFGIKSVNEQTGEQEYTPIRFSSSWFNVVYGQKWKPGIFVGYAKNLGTSDALYAPKGNDAKLYGTGTDLNQLVTAGAELTYNVPHWKFGLEYTLSSAWYGSLNTSNGKIQDTHAVCNNRIVAVAMFMF